ncbi:MAG: VCBS repeat-containing protein [Nitrospirae bacterium]|nr:VCBS repeat-containing protein [Nitrospirota bacterium]
MKHGKLLAIILMVVAMYAAMCHTTAEAASEGATLYAQYCASCHGATPSGTRLNASAATITNAIATIPDMKSNTALQTLTSTQIQSIATYFSAYAGSTLFPTYCISCHNTIPATDPRLIGATATKITNAIANVSQMRGSSALQTLTSTQIQNIANYTSGAGLSSNWVAVGIGDFNADGNRDILWRDMVTGTNYVWLMSGTSFSSGLSLPSLTGNTWLIAGAGDFNRDGYADIFWRNVSTGENVIWLMNGANVQSQVTLTTFSDRNWIVAGVGDFNADTFPDILWRHLVYGYNAIWYLNGTTLNGSASLPDFTDVSWVIGGASDINHDGYVDIVWRNKTSGYNAIWFLSGTTVSSSQQITAVTDTSWSIAAVGDLDGDGNGNADILWRNQNAGSNMVWLMNGASITGSVTLPTFGP